MTASLCQRLLRAVPAELAKNYSVSVRERPDCAVVDLRLVPNHYKEGHAICVWSYTLEALAKMPVERLATMVADNVAEMVRQLDVANA